MNDEKGGSSRSRVDLGSTLGLRNRIERYLKNYKNADGSYAWISGTQIENLALEAGHKGSNASRRLRELAQDGILEKALNEEGYVFYRYREHAYVEG